MAGNANSGRPKGARTHARVDVSERLAAMNCKPFDGMARIAKIAEAQGDHAIAVQCYKELAKYVAPQLKAIEHSGDIDTSLTIVINKGTDYELCN